MNIMPIANYADIPMLKSLGYRTTISSSGCLAGSRVEITAGTELVSQVNEIRLTVLRSYFLFFQDIKTANTELFKDCMT